MLLHEIAKKNCTVQHTPYVPKRSLLLNTKFLNKEQVFLINQEASIYETNLI